MNESPRYIGTRIAPVLQVQGRKARWLAARVGVSESMISKIAAGDRFAGEELASRIAEVLGVEIGMLFELHDRSESDSRVCKVA